VNPAKTAGKAIIFAVLGGAILFFTGTFLGIVTLGIITAIENSRQDFTIAYRIVGLSTGTMGFFAGLLYGIIRDIRRG
jgi:hypothetical protein